MMVGALPRLVNTTLFGAPDVPTLWLPNEMDVADRTFSPPAGFTLRAAPGDDLFGFAFTATPSGAVLSPAIFGEETGADGITPFPASVTPCGLPPPLSLSRNEAARGPAVPGVKVTVKVQLKPGPSVLPHVVVLEKSEALAPRKAACQMFIAIAPTFFKVINCHALAVPTVWSGKVRLAGVNFAPVVTPVRMTTCGPPAALSSITSDDLRGPAPVGVKVTAMLHVALAGSEDPVEHVVPVPDTAKSPEAAKLVILTGTVPLLVKTTGCEGGEAPTS